MTLVMNNMVDKISNYLVDNVISNGEILDSDEREILNFGVTRIVEDIPKYIIMLTIAIITNTLFELGIVFVITFFYKTFIGGAHARTNFICLISSNIIFFTPILISKIFKINNVMIYILDVLVFIFSLFVIYYIAPADTEEVPILKANRRRKLKIQGVISLIIVYAVSLFFIKGSDIKEIILFTVLIIDICATKPIYRLLRCKYSYESEEFKEYYNAK